MKHRCAVRGVAVCADASHRRAGARPRFPFRGHARTAPRALGERHAPRNVRRGAAAARGVCARAGGRRAAAGSQRDADGVRRLLRAGRVLRGGVQGHAWPLLRRHQRPPVLLPNTRQQLRRRDVLPRRRRVSLPRRRAVARAVLEWRQRQHLRIRAPEQRQLQLVVVGMVRAAASAAHAPRASPPPCVSPLRALAASRERARLTCPPAARAQVLPGAWRCAYAAQARRADARAPTRSSFRWHVWGAACTRW